MHKEARRATRQDDYRFLEVEPGWRTVYRVTPRGNWERLGQLQSLTNGGYQFHPRRD